jgi:hypothetical protein
VGATVTATTNASWIAEPVPELAGLTPEWVAPDDYVFSRGSTLLGSPVPHAPLANLGGSALPLHLRAAARFDLSRRALRLLYYNVARIDAERLFVTFNRSAAVIGPDGAQPVGGFDRPFRVLRNACGVKRDGSVWFGEYVVEPEPSEIRIYCLPPDSPAAQVVHAFPKGDVRHVHGVYVDPFDQSVWCLTGDRPEQSMILRSPDGFQPFVPIGAGDKTWCAVSLQFRDDGIYYATDAPDEPNAVYRLERGSSSRTAIGMVDGPVYYSQKAGDDLFFAVTAERKAGSANGAATMWHVDARGECTQVVSFTKDRWSVPVFLPGTIAFAGGPGDGNTVFFSAFALAGARRKTFRCRRQTSVVQASSS